MSRYRRDFLSSTVWLSPREWLGLRDSEAVSEIVKCSPREWFRLRDSGLVSAIAKCSPRECLGFWDAGVILGTVFSWNSNFLVFSVRWSFVGSYPDYIKNEFSWFLSLHSELLLDTVMDNLTACLLTRLEYEVLLAMRKATAEGFLDVELAILEDLLEEMAGPVRETEVEVVTISSDDESDPPDISDLMGKLLILVFISRLYYISFLNRFY